MEKGLNPIPKFPLACAYQFTPAGTMPLLHGLDSTNLAGPVYLSSPGSVRIPLIGSNRVPSGTPITSRQPEKNVTMFRKQFKHISLSLPEDTSGNLTELFNIVTFRGRNS